MVCVCQWRPSSKLRTNLNRIFRGGNTSSLSNLNPVNKRRDLVLLSALIEYPGVGLILYETGCAEDLDVVCSDCMAMLVMYELTKYRNGQHQSRMSFRELSTQRTINSRMLSKPLGTTSKM